MGQVAAGEVVVSVDVLEAFGILEIAHPDRRGIGIGFVSDAVCFRVEFVVVFRFVDAHPLSKKAGVVTFFLD